MRAANGLLDSSDFIAHEQSRRLIIARRLQTLETDRVAIEALAVTSRPATHWARSRVRPVETGRRLNVNDLPVVSQDGDFDVVAELTLVELIRVGLCTDAPLSQLLAVPEHPVTGGHQAQTYMTR